MSTRINPSAVPSFTSLPLTSHSIVPQVRLLKFSIRKFNGDTTKWITFWVSFNYSIHINPSLSSVDKFNYFSLLELTAAEAIAGLTLTAVNYDEAISH